MPVMPRLKGKSTKIAWAILGKPLAMQEQKKSGLQAKIDKQLIFEETTRVR
jgi:hypothetical protein